MKKTKPTNSRMPATQASSEEEETKKQQTIDIQAVAEEAPCGAGALARERQHQVTASQPPPKRTLSHQRIELPGSQGTAARTHYVSVRTTLIPNSFNWASGGWRTLFSSHSNPKPPRVPNPSRTLRSVGPVDTALALLEFRDPGFFCSHSLSQGRPHNNDNFIARRQPRVRPTLRKKREGLGTHVCLAAYTRSVKGCATSPMGTDLLRFNGAVERDPAIDAWMKERPRELGAIAQRWFEVMRKCGDEVRELLHDGCPTACLGDAPFGYVNVFTSHVNVGFFHGASLPDPARLLQGSGKYMRHVKLRAGTPANPAALRSLIDAAYSDIKARLEHG